MYHDSFIRMPSHVFHVLYVYRDSFIRIPPHLHTIYSLIRVPWLIDRNAIPRLLCVICVPYVIFVPCCNTHEEPCHTYERVMSHICVPWLIHKKIPSHVHTSHSLVRDMAHDYYIEMPPRVHIEGVDGSNEWMRHVTQMKSHITHMKTSFSHTWKY